MTKFEDLFGKESDKASSSLSLKAVIAIDFGTSRSGFAYAISPADINKENIEAIKNEIEIVGRTEWPGGQHMPYIKTLTEILYSPDHQVEAWGYQARSKHSQLRQNQEATDYHYHKNFKMQLHQSQQRTSDGPVITTSDGKEVLVINVISDYLRELTKVAKENIGNASGGILQDQEIRWCLSVPAIWTDADKKLMRRAAIKAGLISESRADQDRLILILEPEAAAIYCQEKEAVKLQPGTIFMVVDCGGGTVDITVHEIDSDQRLKDAAQGTGGPFGSTYIDQTFRDYLERKLSSHAIWEYYEKEPVDYLESMAEWE
ncbi:MAG: Hsp70 family protein, partial [Moorea sp. SIO1F2]|uniref:Hsp70 family protein n=1 Tax=Moorena sp. SIO1F2 TaxID=2607819 RepID=UPI0013B7C8EB